MPHIIPLNDHRDTVKRLILEPNGGATLQEFSKTGRVEMHLTAEELEIVRTACLLPDCDGMGRDADALDALGREVYGQAVPWEPRRGTLGDGQGTEYPQTIGESVEAIRRHLEETNPFFTLDLDSFILEERTDGRD